MLKLRSLPVLLAAGSCLLLTAAGPADAAKKKCAKKQEKSGCKLKKGAAYEGTLRGGGSAYLQVDRRSWTVSISASDRAAGNGPCNPRFSRTYLEFKGRPKVGRTYTLSQDVRRPDSGVDNAIRVSGKIKITSAKKVKLSGTFSSERAFRDNVFTPCERSLATTAKREK